MCAQLSCTNLDHIQINLTFLKFKIFIQRIKEFSYKDFCKINLNFLGLSESIMI